MLIGGADYINLDLAIEILSRHSRMADEKHLKKSTTKIEVRPLLFLLLLARNSSSVSQGLLPIEGDEIYNGASRRVEEIREFISQRPGSLYSAGSDRGE